MRLGVFYETTVSNGNYRALEPMRAMERRGHTVVWQDVKGHANLRDFATCDVVHVYRRYSSDIQTTLKRLASQGCAITYDNDDDFTAVPPDSPNYRLVGGPAGERAFAESVKVARLARVMTTTSPLIAAKYQEAGVENVEVLDNHLAPGVPRARTRHEGLVIGWVAGEEHRVDADRLGIREALERVLGRHPQVRVECIGVDLKLSERYRWDSHVFFSTIPDRMSSWDLGIAPLADLPFNHRRSAIKLKEYAASLVPWLASPVGPYAGLGSRQGGRLVEDGRWFEELDRLVTHRLLRWRLAMRGGSWAQSQTIDKAAERWEKIFMSAAQAPLQTRSA